MLMATTIRDTVSKYCTLITTSILDAVGIATIRLLLFSVVEVMQLHPLTATVATTKIKEDEEQEQQQIHCIESIMYLLQQYQLRDRIVLQYGWKAILLLTTNPRTTLAVTAAEITEAPVTAPLLQPPLAPSLTHTHNNNEKSNNSTNTTRSTSCIIIRRVEEDAKLVTTVMNYFPRNNMIHYLGCNALWSLIETRTDDADTTTASEKGSVSNSGTTEAAPGVTKETKKTVKRGGWEAVIRGGAVSALLTILQCINTEKTGTTNKFGPCYFVTFLLLLVKNGEAANAAQQFVDLDGIPIVLRTVRMFGIGSMDTNNGTSTNKNIDKTNTDLISTSCLLIGYLIGCVVDGVATISAREILIRHNCIDIAIQILKQNKHEMEIVRMCISLLRLLSSNGNDVMLVGTQQEQQEEQHAQQQQQQQHDLEEEDSDYDGGNDSDLNRHERRRRRRRLTRNSEVSEQQPQQRHVSFHEYGKEGADEDGSSKNKKRRRRQKRERWKPEYDDRNEDEDDVDKDSRIKKMKRHRRQHRQKRKKRQREQELKRIRTRRMTFLPLLMELMTIHKRDELIQFHALYLLATAGNSTEAAMIRHQSIVVPVIVSAMQTYPNNEGMVLVCCLLFWKCLRNDTNNNHEALALLSSSGAIESVITATIAATRNNSNSNNDAAADNDVSVATIAYLLLTYVWDNRPLEQERATQAFGGNRRIISLITNL